MATPLVVPTKNPGEFFIPSLNKTFSQVELREDDAYDTVELNTGLLAKGAEFQLFQNVQNKNEQHTNMPQPRRIQSGDELTVFRIGVHPREARGNDMSVFTDYRKVIGNAQLELKFNRRLITSGPVVKYPSGYGLYGFSNEAAGAGQAAASIGMPSMAAAPVLVVPQVLKDTDDIYMKIRFPDAAWLPVVTGGTAYTAPTLGAELLVSGFLRGLVKSPLGK
ncbi:MAG: hypothetical protein KGI71_05110 [Patescibacteria group bacterium]|nr:hypothetical protein [Patescibacteria group bacterium]